jgi:RNA polymerase sigma-70 factor, ECF subfamily
LSSAEEPNAAFLPAGCAEFPSAGYAESLPAGCAGSEPLSSEMVALLYAEHGAELRRFLQGVLRDGSLAADCLQATFAKLVERGHETRAETRKAWLFRVAFHEAMAVRRRAAAGDKVCRQVAWQGAVAPPSAEEQAIGQEELDRVRAALADLRPEEREMVRMRIYEEKTFAVIAKELSIPLGTALGRMRMALMKLKTKLKEKT